MAKRAIQTSLAPAAIGPYSQAVTLGEMVFCSGQIPLDPENGTIAEGIEDQTAKALQNLTAVLEAADCSLLDVVKTTVYVTSMEEFPKMNSVYEQFFSETPPARATVEVSALPMGVSVEIDAIAIRGRS